MGEPVPSDPHGELPPVAILAGGLATRLRPITERIPKSLVPVAGRPFVEWQLELLASRGIRRAVLCVGHLGEMIADHVGDGSRWGVEVGFSPDGPALLGTGGAVRKALPLLGDRFFVLYGDSYLPADFRAASDAFVRSARLALMAVCANEGRWDRSNVWMEGGRIRLYDKRNPLPEMRHIDYGLSLYRKEAFAGREGTPAFDLSDLMADLVARGEMEGFPVEGRFYEIGSAAGIADLEGFLAARAEEPRADTPPPPPGRRAIFFDRDGILNEVVLRDGVVSSPRSEAEFRLKPEAGRIFEAARRAGYLCVVATNQPDIERGLLAPADLAAMHRIIRERLHPDAIECCPASSPGDPRKKPNPGMILEAAEKLGIDLRHSWIVGDSAKDIEAGLGTILLATGYNREIQHTADFAFSSLAEIARFVSTFQQRASR